MLYVSFVEIFIKAKDALVAELGARNGYWVTTLAFFGGMLLIALIDKMVPSFENPHEVVGVEEMQEIDKMEHHLEEMEHEHASEHTGHKHKAGSLTGWDFFRH